MAMWANGRVECCALAPGVPSSWLTRNGGTGPSRRASISAFTSRASWLMADGLRVQPPSMLVGMIAHRWGRPAVVICDRFRLPELARRCTQGMADTGPGDAVVR